MSEPHLQGATWVAKVNHDALLLAAADALAAWLHRDDRDKQGKPLIGHCRRVAAMLRDQGWPVEVQAAGLLHDVGEESGWETLNGILAIFGLTIYKLVDLMTRRSIQDYQADYIQRIVDDGADAPAAVAIKLADLRDNLDPDRPIPESLRKRYLKAVERLESVP